MKHISVSDLSPVSASLLVEDHGALVIGKTNLDCAATGLVGVWAPMGCRAPMLRMWEVFELFKQY